MSHVCTNYINLHTNSFIECNLYLKLYVIQYSRNVYGSNISFYLAKEINYKFLAEIPIVLVI